MNINNSITVVAIMLTIWLGNHLLDDSDDELRDEIRDLKKRVKELEDNK